jgi:ABC-type transporter Mla maintaining outer membrane lipid asymmetry ATPase subunit MlaF
MIQLRSVTKNYRVGGQDVRALDSVDLEIGQGEFVSVVGPSGAGKSTLLHILGALDTPDSGSVHYGDEDITKLGEREQAALRLRNNQRALVAYKPGGVLSCPIVIFSVTQPLLPEERKWLGIEDLPATEWQRYSSAPLEVITVPGDHYSLFVDVECLQAVADHLPAVLGRAK